MGKKILVPISQGSEEMEAIIIVDLLRRAGLNVKIAGDNEIITCARGTKIIPDIMLDSIAEENDFDAVVLPGGLTGTKNLMENNNLRKILLQHNLKKGVIGAICAAPLILAQHKIINNQSVVTSHPSVKSQITSDNYSMEIVVTDGNIITSRGAGTAIEFSFKLIEILAGVDIAKTIANDIVY